MENPLSWTAVHHAIDEAIMEFHKQQELKLCGASEVSLIFRKLAEKGFLKDPNLPALQMWPGQKCRKHPRCYEKPPGDACGEAIE